MPQESVPSTTAAPSRYRVKAQNSVARNMLVVALDPASGGLGGLFLEHEWRGVVFAGFAERGAVFRDGGWRQVAGTSPIDVVMMLASPGQALDAAREIGGFALERSIKVASVLLRQRAEADQVSQSLKQLRPYSRTLTILDDDSYLADFLHALGG